MLKDNKKKLSSRRDNPTMLMH